MTTEVFDELLVEIVEDLNVYTLLAIDGVYEILSNDLHSDVLNLWEKRKTEEVDDGNDDC